MRASGAAYKVAPTVLWELGAEVIAVACEPNGTNINEQCGAVHPHAMQSQVVAHGADLGIALDGDADPVHRYDLSAIRRSRVAETALAWPSNPS